MTPMRSSRRLDCRVIYRAVCAAISPPFILAVLAVQLTPSTQAQVPAWSLDGPAFSATPEETLAAAAKVVPEKFAEVTVLLEEEKDVLDAAGRLTRTHRLVFRVEAQAALESWSEASVEWEAFYQKEPTIQARVIRPNGAVAELDPKTVTDGPAREQDEGTYSDARIHKAPLPGIQVGAIVEEVTTLVDSEPFFSGGGVYRTYLQRGVPVVRSRLVVEAPLDLPLLHRESYLPDVSIQQEEAGGVRRLTFDQGYLPSSEGSDIGLATRIPRAPLIEFSTAKSWESVAESYRQLAEPQIQPEHVKAILETVAKPATSNTGPNARLALLQALVSRLHAEIRYTGIEFGESKLKPETPAEILKRHYGDCKDKASLLVAMLRASGIPANLALLDAGPGRDVTPELPGMNQFDHAIVYVPAATGSDKPLWIDATADTTRVGDLPYMDQGRLALIIAEGTRQLTLTPEAQPEDSVLLETRDFQLADYGPAHVIETSETTGHIDAVFRADYGEALTKQQKSSLETYAKNAYATKGEPKVEHGDARNFDKPFFLRLDMAKASRGSTDLKEAVVYAFPTGAYANLPRWFSTDPDPSGAKLTEEEQADRQKAESHRTTEYQVEPFIAERRYRITPPPGFALRALPADKTMQMGPATLVEKYSVDSAGVVTASSRFNSGKNLYSLDEALALRKAVLAADKEDGVAIVFDQTGSKLMAEGKVREALAADRSIAEAHPKDALPRVRLANALLEAGLGEKARSEALLATQLDPKSAVALSVLGWVLQFNEIGVQFGKGFELNRALEAYRKSKELDPEELSTRTNLSILYEYDVKGVRYASVPGLKNAIQEYRDLIQQDKNEGERYRDNILFDMLYAHEYKELLAEFATLPANSLRNGLAISATVALDGVDAGIKRADRIAGGSSERSTALRNAGAQLVNLRMYAQAADILAAGIEGQENATAVTRQIEIFRNLKPFDEAAIQDSEPVSVVQRLMAASLTGKLSQAVLTKLLYRQSFGSDEEWQKNLVKGEEAASGLQAMAIRMGMTPTVLADLTLGSMKVASQGDDATGYRITLQSIGAEAQQFFVTKADGQFKIVASKSDFSEVGTAALYFLHHGHEAEAQSLLDWKRELLHRGGGDDPLDGPLMPRFWTVGESKGSDAIELASASLLTESKTIADLLPALAAHLEKLSPAQPSGKTKPDSTDLNLVLAYGYLHVNDEANARKAAEALLKENPDSITAIRLVGLTDFMKKDWADWNSMVDAHLAKHPTDRDLLALKAMAQQSQGDFSGARKTLKTVLDGGQATSNDYNNYSWNALFENKVDQDAIQAAQQSNMLSKNSSFADLHTLACLYAAEGKTSEARQTLMEAINAANLSQPDSPTWYAFGAIYEQYGVTDAAIAAFKKVEKPEGIVLPTETYVLAQSHLKSLHAIE